MTRQQGTEKSETEGKKDRRDGIFKTQIDKITNNIKAIHVLCLAAILEAGSFLVSQRSLFLKSMPQMHRTKRWCYSEVFFGESGLGKNISKQTILVLLSQREKQKEH